MNEDQNLDHIYGGRSQGLPPSGVAALPAHPSTGSECHHYYIHTTGNSRVHAGDVYYASKVRLRYVEGAAYDTKDQVPRACHPATRTDLLRAIHDWAEQPGSKSIFWLNGAAGTGKSTISYTVAQSLAQHPPSDYVNLGASFFFKRGERDRASAALFFPTIVHQLALKVRGLDILVGETVAADPCICSKSLGEQFDKLLRKPLQALDSSQRRPTYIIVVDALDECDNESDIRIILQLWSSLSQITSICLRLFLTSRPELPIRLGFTKMSANVYQDLVLHEVPRPIIEHDILTFLKDAFATIREDYNADPLTVIPPDNDWPGIKMLQELTSMAVPLFIIAVTIYRFVHDPNWDPQERLDTMLQSRKVGQMSQMAQTYLPVLQQMTAYSRDKTDEERLYTEFRTVVGSIVTLAEPLSMKDLAVLLNLPLRAIALRLKPLYSVLQIGDTEAPVRPLHLSFSEFLNSQELQNKPFGIDGPATHSMLLAKCLELLSRPSPEGLSENMYNLNYPGQPRRDLAPAIVRARLPSSMQYACRYWAYHAQQSRTEICDDGKVHDFLQKHFLHWLEALSLLDCLADALQHIGTLQSLLATNGSMQLVAFLEDARRFVLANRYICDLAPLQLYSSAVVFTPQASIVRQIYKKIPEWIQRAPITPDTWSAELQKLEGHIGSVYAVSFSPDGSQLASVSEDKTVRLWDAKTGQEAQKLEGHTHSVIVVTFSPDGSLLASASKDGTVRLWDAKTGQEAQELEGHTDQVVAVAFSPDGSLLASSSWDETVRLWDTKTGQEVQKLSRYIGWINKAAFSPDGSLLASASEDGTVRLCDAKTGQNVQELEGHTEPVEAVTFSPDGSLLASASGEETVRLWDAKTGQEVQELEGHTGSVNAVAFSPDGSLLASASDDSTVRLWNTKTGQEVQVLEGHTNAVAAVVFSPDGSQLASASYDRTIRLWDAGAGQEVQGKGGHSDRVTAVAFSPDGSQLASASFDHTVRLWNAKTGQEVQKLEGHSNWVEAVAFSPDGSLLASASSDRTVRLWDAKTGQEVQELEGHSDRVMAVAFSPDGSLLASSSWDRTVRLWDAKTGQELQGLEGHSDIILAVGFSPDGSLLASASEDGTVRLWDAKTGQGVQKLEGHGDLAQAVGFSLDGSQLASGSENGTVWLWEVKTAQQLCVLTDNPPIRAIAFSTDGRSLLTNRGIIRIDGRHSISGNQSRETSKDFMFKGAWIQCGNQNVLWLPHEYRSDTSAVYGNLLAIGRLTGHVSFLQIEYS